MKTLPFGKFKGTPIREVDDAYLTWLATRELREPLLSAVAAEQQHRRQAGALPPGPEPERSHTSHTAPPLSPALRAAAAGIVRVGYAALVALDDQPDAVATLRAAREALEQLLDAVERPASSRRASS